MKVIDAYQSFLIFFINLFTRPFAGMKDKNRDRVVIVALFLLNMIPCIIGQYAFRIKFRYLYIFAAACLLFGIAILFSARGKMKRVHLNKPMTVLWFLCGLLILLSGILYSEDWLMNAVLFLVLMPCFFIVWGNRGKFAPFVVLLEKAVVGFFTIFIFLCLFFGPFRIVQYSGIFNNPNKLAQYMTIVIPILLFRIRRLYQANGAKGNKIYTFCLFGFAAAFLILSQSRTGLLAAGLMCLAFIFFSVQQNRRKAKKILKIVLICILLAAVFVPITYYLVNLLSVPFQELLKEDGIGLGSLSQLLDNLALRFEHEGQNLDEISSGRLQIWKSYAARVRLFGNKSYRFTVYQRGLNTSSHNTILQIMFENGLFAGIVFFLFNILSGLRTIKYYLYHRNKKARYPEFPLILSIGFLVTYLLESIFSPFSYLITLVYMMLQAPLFDPVLDQQRLSLKELFSLKERDAL